MYLSSQNDDYSIGEYRRLASHAAVRLQTKVIHRRFTRGFRDQADFYPNAQKYFTYTTPFASVKVRLSGATLVSRTPRLRSTISFTR